MTPLQSQSDSAAYFLMRPTLINADHFHEVLSEEFERRCSKQSTYSLRAYALDLGLSRSRLTDILKGRQGLSKKGADSIAAALNFSEQEKDLFFAIIESKFSRSILKRRTAKKKVSELRDRFKIKSISVDQFKVISDWYHMALIELTYLKDFKYDLNWMAQKLNITTAQTHEALERLIRYKLVIEKNDRLVATDDFTYVGENIPSDAIQKFHNQMIHKGLESIRQQSVNERSLLSLVFAFDAERFSEMQKDLEEFRQNMLLKYGSGENKSAVYALALQFFSLTKQQEKS